MQSRVGPDGIPRGGRVIVGVHQEPEMLSVLLHPATTTTLACNLIFSHFVKYDDHFHLIPDLIRKIPTKENGGISPDGCTITYHLRTDVLWHDGQRLTSRDAKFTYRLIMDPHSNVESREGWDIVKSCHTPDDSTIVFHLKHAAPDFVSMTFFEEAVLPEHLLRNYTGEKFHSAPFHHAPVGSGPFRFKSWTSGSNLILTANRHYYGVGPYLDSIIFKFIPNENTLLVQMKTGDIDWFDNANAEFVDQLTAIEGVKVYRTPMFMYEHLDFNTENSILSDRTVRQAIARATNKKEIAERIYQGLVTVAALDEKPDSPYYNKEAAARTRYDPMSARVLLRQAGWSDSDGDGILDRDGKPLRLTISAAAGQPNRERTELVLRDQYRKIGIDLRIRNYNPTVLYGTFEDGGIIRTGKYDIAMYAWLSSPAPASKEAIYAADAVSPHGQNNTRIRNRELTKLVKEGAIESDPARRVQIYRRVSDILVEEAPVVPLFWYTAIDPCTKRLHNFRPNPTPSADTWNASTWYLDPPADVSSR